MLVHFNPAPLHPSPVVLDVLQSGFAWLSLANIGVLFFYTLSAFLLTYLAARESTEPGGFSVTRFWSRRCLRIWPLYFVVVAAALLQARSMEPRGVAWSWTIGRLPLFTFFLSNWSLAFNHIGGYVDRSTPELAVLWSIGVEEQFYLVYPLLFLIATRSSRARIAVTGFLLAAALCFRAAFLFIPAEGLNPPSSGG